MALTLTPAAFSCDVRPFCTSKAGSKATDKEWFPLKD